MTNLQHFIQEYNGFDRIGGGYLYDLVKNNDIFHSGNTDQVVAYISRSTWCETIKLIEPTCRDYDYTRRILWMSWLMLKGETMLRQEYTTDSPTSHEDEPIDDDDDSELDEDFEDEDEDEDEKLENEVD